MESATKQTSFPALWPGFVQSAAPLVGPALAAGVLRVGPAHFSGLERLTSRCFVVWGFARSERL